MGEIKLKKKLLSVVAAIAIAASIPLNVSAGVHLLPRQSFVNHLKTHTPKASFSSKCSNHVHEFKCKTCGYAEFGFDCKGDPNPLY